MDVSVHHGRATVALRGEIDVATAADLQERATGLLRRPISRLTFDMGEVSMVDSTGLGALVRISQQAHAVDCPFALINVSPFVREVLETTGLSEALNVQPTATPEQEDRSPASPS
jgi:anti-sigma B factor antagonist